MQGMARIPLEDNYDDVLRKAQRGMGVTNAQLAQRAEVTEEAVESLMNGTYDDAVARRVARHLKLGPKALSALGNKEWYPSAPAFPVGFAAFNTPHEDMTVNSYLIWDERSRHAAAFDTGGSCTDMLDLVAEKHLTVRYIFLTHTHEDHVADLDRLVQTTKGEVWASSREPSDYPGAKTFDEGTFFHVGPFSVKTLSTWGHSQGGTTYYVQGLSYPLAIVGDSLFASSMGGGMVSYKDALENNLKKVLCLPADTVLACGHGPLTTVGQERRHNPFIASS